MRAIPVLSTTKGYLTNNSDRAAYLLTFFIYNPGEVSDYFEDYLISLRDLASKNQQVPDALVSAVEGTLTKVYERYFPDLIINVEVEQKYIDGYKYGLKINIQSAPMNSDQFEPIILSKTIAIDDDYRISLNYTPSQN